MFTGALTKRAQRESNNNARSDRSDRGARSADVSGPAEQRQYNTHAHAAHVAGRTTQAASAEGINEGWSAKPCKAIIDRLRSQYSPNKSASVACNNCFVRVTVELTE